MQADSSSFPPFPSDSLSLKLYISTYDSLTLSNDKSFKDPQILDYYLLSSKFLQKWKASYFDPHPLSLSPSLLQSTFDHPFSLLPSHPSYNIPYSFDNNHLPPSSSLPLSSSYLGYPSSDYPLSTISHSPSSNLIPSPDGFEEFNEDLMEKDDVLLKQILKTKEFVVIKKGLQVGIDYYIVNKELHDFFKKDFKGITIKRKATILPDGTKFVEAYPREVKLLLKKIIISFLLPLLFLLYISSPSSAPSPPFSSLPLFYPSLLISSFSSSFILILSSLLLLSFSFSSFIHLSFFKLFDFLFFRF